MTEPTPPLLRDLSEKLNALDIETAFEDGVLFAAIRGGSSLPDDGVEIALHTLELGPRAVAVRAMHFAPIDPGELPDAGKVPELLAEVRDECVFARSTLSSDEDGILRLMTDASFLLSDLRQPQIQTLLTGLTLFAEEVLLTIGTLFYTEAPTDKETHP
ncbi:MAG: hypothetical protein Q4C89_01960 [Deinococcus sp.]|uniref:hypothetical protein n=1 Tax=Deinococcus sp. TaxID=47478 RepID=UPI0026DB6962|nr:hypothetical protein [Deinococcus sp.]MDO4244770.1 hypothetical protein [Deinococcus sp.]